MIRAFVAGIVVWLGAGLMPCRAQQSQVPDTTILVITGDLSRPYEIINGGVWVQEVTVNELRTTEGQWKTALQKLLETVIAEIRRAGGNALIRAQLQFVPRAFYIEPQRVRGGETHGLVVVYGTIVKYSQQPPH